MKRILFVSFAAWFLSGCATDPMVMNLPPPDGLPREALPPPQVYTPQSTKQISVQELQTQLGLNRSTDDLGFADKNFDGCRVGYKGEGENCGSRYLSVVHFRLVCRDTVGTTSRVPSSLTPLSGRHMQWRLGGLRGNLTTDSQGYGQVQLVSTRPVQTERFMLIIGTKMLGVEAGEVSQIVLPGNWCPNVAMK